MRIIKTHYMEKDICKPFTTDQMREALKYALSLDTFEYDCISVIMSYKENKLFVETGSSFIRTNETLLLQIVNGHIIHKDPVTKEAIEERRKERNQRKQ